ncbi:MAG: hypothetical protein IJZ10_03225, partial [Thermoguttaceae bacterium]|nr:hypothetical protein [Thermoguttaceae bacterium]
KTITLNGADLEVNRAGLKIDASSLYDAATETPGVTIDADGRSRGFNVKAGTKAEPVTIKGLTITGGSARDGGGIYVSEAGALALYDSALIGNRATSWGGGGLCADGPATVVNCRFVENEARDGGGLCVATGATLTLADSTFIGNAAFGSGWDGGAIRVYADCVATIDGCEIRENEAAKGGGISVATGGKATISNSTIADNVATVYGGGGLGINGEATISNSTITGNSSPTYGGGLNVNGVASIDGSVISGNTATYGGGIHSDGPSGVLSLTDSTLSNNVATSHGGGLCVDGRGTVENVVFSGNAATYGGGIHVGGSQSLTVVASEIIENTATNEGGGISVTDDAALTLTDSLVDANEITAGAKNVYGGGIYAAGTLTVENSDITNNVANGINDAFGGGIYAKKTSTLLNSNVSNNLATGKFAVRGGGVDARGTLIATDSTFDGNVATHTTDDWSVYGGGIYFDASAGTATLTNCVLTNNAATTDGGAFRAQTGTATLTGCAISNNSATYGGGVGVSGTASATLTDCSITENVASGYGGGVALFDEAKAALTNCVVSNNTATRGAGLLNRGADATATLTNVAITGNVASSYGGGVYSEGTTFCANVLIAGNSGSYGGAFYGEAGTATFVNATLTGNSATKNGGGIYEYSASTTLCNAIVAQNAPNDVRIASKASIVGRNSLSSFTAWNAGEKNYVYNASLPLFVDAANGDYALADGSQAINKGYDAYAVDAEGNALQPDLAGRARLVGAVDLGAYEYRTPEAPSLVVTTNLDVVDAYDDKISLREAIRYAASNATLGDAITFAPSLKGATIKLAGERLEISQAGLTVDATSLYDATTQKPGVTVDADGKSRVFYLTDGTTSQPIALKGLTITGGKTADAGGGVYASGATTFANCVVSGTAAANGGGVSAYGGGGELVNCEISGNTATNYGGGVC